MAEATQLAKATGVTNLPGGLLTSHCSSDSESLAHVHPQRHGRVGFGNQVIETTEGLTSGR